MLYFNIITDKFPEDYLTSFCYSQCFPLCILVKLLFWVAVDFSLSSLYEYDSFDIVGSCVRIFISCPGAFGWIVLWQFKSE